MVEHRRTPPSTRVLRRAAVGAIITFAVGGATGCSTEEPSAADRRAEQVVESAAAAGLGPEIASFVALASRGIDATFTLELTGADGRRVRVTSRPPDRRVDVFDGTDLVESHVVVDGDSYRCPPDPTDPCERTASFVEAPGIFDDDAVDETIDALVEQLDEYTLRIEPRAVLDVDASCLVTTERATGTEELLCLSPEGVVLVADVDGERVDATFYTTDVPDGAFDLDDA